MCCVTWFCSRTPSNTAIARIMSDALQEYSIQLRVEQRVSTGVLCRGLSALGHRQYEKALSMHFQ